MILANKKLWTFIALICFVFQAFAQAPEFTIKGKIEDEISKKSVEFASIALYALPDSQLVTGILADEKGFFELDVSKSGSYYLAVAFIGYASFKSKPFILGSEEKIKFLGTYYLKPVSQQLKEVEISGEKELYTQNIDKKVFNVEKSLVSVGGSAIDVLKQIPTVSTDADGNVTMRGSGSITVLINGKPSGLTGTSKQAILDQLPASSIQSVELITNPSAKYDPDGVSGILNIVLKKNTKGGMGGTYTIGIGNRNKANAGLSLYYKKDKLSVSTIYGYRYGQNWYRGINNRKNFLTDTTTTVNQSSEFQLYAHNHIFNINADYDLNKRNFIGLGTSFGYTTSDQNEEFRYQFRGNSDQLIQSRIRANGVHQNNYNADVQAYYKHLFNKLNQEITISASYGYSNALTNSGFNQRDYKNSGEAIRPLPSISNINPLVHNKIALVQLDFTTPITKKIKLETGLKATNRNLDNNLSADTFSYAQNANRANLSISNHFVYNEQVDAAYAMTQFEWKKFAFQPGLRYEQTFISIQQLTTNQSFNYDYGNLFPSIHILRKLPKEQEFTLSYSKRINRPTIDALNPFPSYFDPLNLVYGNPGIRPEYLNIFELGYNKSWAKYSLNAVLYYRMVDGPIQRYRTVTPESVSITEFKNLGNGYSSGIELTSNIEFTKWLKAIANINGFLFSISSAPNLPGKTYRDAVTGNGKITLNFKLPLSTDLQLSGNYMFPYPMLQGSFQGFNGIDLAVKRDIWKKKLSATLALTDVFDTKLIQVYSSDITYDATIIRKRESRIITLNLSYKFGKELGIKTRVKKVEINQSGGEGGG